MIPTLKSIFNTNQVTSLINLLTKNVTTLISGKEDVANKQDSLTPDGTGVKYPTVDAINAATFASESYVTSAVATKQNKFNAANTASGTTSVTINATSGVATFTESIPTSNEFTTFTINNSSVSTGYKIFYSLEYNPNDAEFCNIASYYCGSGVITFYVTNTSGQSADQPKVISFQILN